MIGNPELSVEQSKVQMAVWCMLPAPLFMSNDPRTIAKKYKDILINEHAIEINQDSLASPAERVFHNETVDVWTRNLSNKRHALLVLNRTKHARITVTIPLDEVFNHTNNKNSSHFKAFNIFTQESQIVSFQANSDFKSKLVLSLLPTSVAFFKLTPV